MGGNSCRGFHCRPCARRHPARPVERRLPSLYRALRPVGQRHADPCSHHHRRPFLCDHWIAGRHPRLAQAMDRQGGDHSGAGLDADHADFCLPHSHAPPVRQQSGIGHAGDWHLCHPANGARHDARPVARPPGTERLRRNGRLFTPPETLAHLDPLRPANVDGGCEPGDNACPQHGDYRLDDRRRGPWLRCPPGASRSQDRSGNGSWIGDCRPRHSARPPEPGGGRAAPVEICRAPSLLARLPAFKPCFAHSGGNDLDKPLGARFRQGSPCDRNFNGPRLESGS